MKMKNLIAIISGILIITGCAKNPHIKADSIYFGGDILTMEGESAQYTND